MPNGFDEQNAGRRVQPFLLQGFVEAAQLCLVVVALLGQIVRSGNEGDLEGLDVNGATLPVPCPIYYNITYSML